MIFYKLRDLVSYERLQLVPHVYIQQGHQELCELQVTEYVRSQMNSLPELLRVNHYFKKDFLP